MSGKLVGQVYERQLGHAEQSILIAMADHADDFGNNVFPSIPYVAWKTGYSERQVQRIVASLRESKALVMVCKATPRRPTEYRINLAALPPKSKFRGDTTSPLAVGGDIAMSSLGVTLSPFGGDIAASPEPSYGTAIGEPSSSRVATATADAGAALDAGDPHDAPDTGVTPPLPESMANAVNGTHPAKNGHSPKAPRAARGGAAPLGPGAVVYRDVVHLTPNHVQRAALDDALTTHGEARMRAVLSDWLGRGYSPKNVTGMVDAMAHGLNGYARNGNGRAEPDFSQVIL